jgi:hypothetical protein
MITCFGYRRGKYQLFEHDPNVLLHFTGPDAGRFKQIAPPAKGDRATQRVKFSLTVADLQEMGFLPTFRCRAHSSGSGRRRRR